MAVFRPVPLPSVAQLAPLTLPGRGHCVRVAVAVCSGSGSVAGWQCGWQWLGVAVGKK
jgi:hypothetical protein